jgi:antitoxin component of MazEF toxin-antitoxin module
VSRIVDMIQGIIIKIGNYYAIRVPKRYIDNNNLKLGDKVSVDEPLTKQRQAIDALIKHGKKRGPIEVIKNI